MYFRIRQKSLYAVAKAVRQKTKSFTQTSIHSDNIQHIHEKKSIDFLRCRNNSINTLKNWTGRVGAASFDRWIF